MAANLLLKSKKEKTKLKTKSSKKKTQKKQEMKQRKISLAAEIVFFFSSRRINDFQTCKLNFRVKQHSKKRVEPSNSRIAG